MNAISKIIISIVIIAGALAGGFLIWRYLAQPSSSPLQQQTTNQPQNTPSTPKLQVMSDGPVFDYWVNKASNEIYFVTENGSISKMDTSGEQQTVSAQSISNLNYIKPAADGSAAIIAIGYPQSPAFSIFNTKTKTFLPLPAGPTAAAWDPKSNNRLAVLQGSGPTERLKLLTLNNLKTVELLKIASQDLDLDWPSADLIYLKERPSEKNPNSIWLYNIKTQTISLFAQGLELVIKWLPGKDIGFRWSANALNIINFKNQELASMGFKTSPDKCVFVGTTIIDCAVNVGRSGASLNASPIEYLKGSARPQDAIYFISGFDPAQNNKLVGLNLYDSAVTGSNLDVRHLELLNNDLLFMNNYDHKLYSLPL